MIIPYLIFDIEPITSLKYWLFSGPFLIFKGENVSTSHQRGSFRKGKQGKREENAAKQYLFTILKTQRGAGAKISPVSIVFYEEGRMRGRVRSLVERTMREIISGCLVGGWATWASGPSPSSTTQP